MPDNSLVPQGAQQLANISTKRVDLNAIYAQMQAMQNANKSGGGGGGASYDIKGKTKIDLNKNGTFSFISPFDGKSYGGKMLTVGVVDAKFGLERWLSEGEEIEGIDRETQKGPLCRSSWYTDPLTQSRSSTGMFPQPAWSPFHAQKMLPDLHGYGGHDGKQGETACMNCPFAQKGAKGACKSTGMLEVVIFGVGDERMEKPVYGFIKLSTVNVISFDQYLKELEKVHKIGLAQQVICKLEAMKVSDKGKVYAKIGYHPATKVNQQALDLMNQAIEDSEALLVEAGETSSKPKGGNLFDDDDSAPF
jgi:hypothetical protein